MTTRKRLQQSKYGDNLDVVDTVLILLDTWISNEIQLTPEDRDIALEAFTRLAKGEALEPREQAKYTWEPYEPTGSSQVGRIVRIRADADSDLLPAQFPGYRGREGRITATRRGDVIVCLPDLGPVGIHFNPAVLERRVEIA